MSQALIDIHRIADGHHVDVSATYHVIGESVSSVTHTFFIDSIGQSINRSEQLCL